MSAVPPIATKLLRRSERSDVPKATDAPQQTASLFDHLVCAKQDRCRYRKAESLGSFDVDGHLKFGGQLDRQLRRFCAVQNTIDIGRGTQPPQFISQVFRYQVPQRGPLY